MKQTSRKSQKILGVKVSSISKDEVLSFVTTQLKNRSKFFITTPNPEIIVAAQKDKKLMSALNSADIALPDGTGLRLAGNIKETLTGREMFEELLSLANGLRLKIYLLGATPTTNKAAVAKVKNNYPHIKVIGTGDIQVNKEGYYEIDKYRKKHIEIVRHINAFKPDLLFVAFGAPKQEKWIYHNLDKLNIGGAMVVGGALDYFSGKALLPPTWLAKAGLEWLWRAITQPKRIRRIIKAVIIFPLLFLKSKLTH